MRFVENNQLSGQFSAKLYSLISVFTEISDDTDMSDSLILSRIATIGQYDIVCHVREDIFRLFPHFFLSKSAV